MDNLSRNNKHFLILVTQSFPYGIVESSFLKEEIKALDSKFNVTIVSRNVKDVQYVDIPQGVTVFRYDPSKFYNPLFLFFQTLLTKNFYKELCFLICKKKVDWKNVKKCISIQMRVLHFSKYLYNVRQQFSGIVVLYSYWNDYACFALSRVKRKGDFLVSRLHGGDLYELDINNRYQPYKNSYDKSVDLFSFISNNGLEYFNTTYFDVSRRSSINYLGVPARSTSYSFSLRKNIKIVSFSYVRDIKRIDRIIDALSKISDIDVFWTHIGARYLYDKVREYAEQKLTNKTNIKYQFLGEMKNEDALDYMSNNEFDFLINVSLTEGMPMTMMEAFSMSLPVIGTKVGGVPEVVRDSYNGYLLGVDYRDEELISILEKYVNLPYEDKIELREHAKETWRSTFYDITNYKRFSQTIEDRIQLL